KRICELEYEIRKTTKNGLKKDSKLMLDQAQILYSKNLIKKYGKIQQGIIDLEQYQIDLSLHFLNRIPNEPRDEKNKLGKIFRHRHYNNNKYYLVVSPDTLNRNPRHPRVNVIEVKIEGDKGIILNEIDTLDKYNLKKFPIKTLNDFEVDEINQAFFVQGKNEITIQIKNDFKKVIEK
ncbi:hypothetical protein, partial [Bernardetia sp.]|uniref:hypothetical protein n=1 Tax=Bernardetia sp. TaxID=1937974 RepID=UPI0025C1C45C